MTQENNPLEIKLPINILQCMVKYLQIHKQCPEVEMLMIPVSCSTWQDFTYIQVSTRGIISINFLKSNMG